MAQSAGEPLHLGALGSGSDYTVFIDHLGVPSLGPGYGSPNGIYHSLYDTLNWFLKFGDPGYKYGVAQADMVGRIMMRLASAEVLPFDSTGTADAVGRHLEELSALDSEGEMREALATVASANGRMRTAAVEANLAIETLLARGARYLDGKNEELDELNGLIMKVERDYLDERGLPRRPWYRNLLYAPGYYTGYAAKTLPGVRAAMEEGEWELARQQAGRLREALRRAEQTLGEAAELARKAERSSS